MQKKVSTEKATEEITAWLDYKKVSDAKREASEAHIKVLTGGIEDGILVLNEDKTITHTLNFSSEGEAPITALIYKPRVKVGTVQGRLNQVKTSDADGRIASTIAAVSGQPLAVIKNLDTEDYRISEAIAVFFL